MMMNTCHCVIVFLMGLQGEIQYNFAFCVGQSYNDAADMAPNGQAPLQLFKTNLRWHIIFTVLFIA